MSLPENWIRRVEDQDFPTFPAVVYECGALLVRVNCAHVFIEGAIHDVGDRDALISILFRATRQRAHLSAHPEGPPLPEDKEETEIVA